MNIINEIGDGEFVPFLQDLGVETYKKSFEWMLNDPSFAGVLKWLYNNLDHNNALTAREEYRYIELEKSGCLLTSEDLQSSIAKIKEDYPGICLPGDYNSKGDIELDVVMQKDRLNVLEKQEMVVKDLIRQNEVIKEELTLELTRLSAAHHQCVEDESTLAEECTGLALELETITDDVIEVITNNLEMYASCKGDKEVASRFFTYAPLDSYRQTQSLFRSHYELFVSKNLVNRQNDVSDEELRATLLEAKDMEERYSWIIGSCQCSQMVKKNIVRIPVSILAAAMGLQPVTYGIPTTAKCGLSNAAFAYLDSKAELSGEQAKLALISNYQNVHPSQITSIVMETQSALELLEQEENILEEEMQNSVQQFVKSRTSLAVNTAAAAAVNVRQHMLNSLTHIVDIWQEALSLDRLLYLCLRHELRTTEEFVQFATQLSQYVLADNCAIASRIASMNEICADQEICELRQQSSNQLLNVLSKMLGGNVSDESVLVKLYNDLQADVKELKVSADEGLRRKELALVEMNKSSKPLSERIWDGCTKQPNCWDRTVAALSHSLHHQMAAVDVRVKETSLLFTTVKSGDKQNLRKLWQWFLTDPPRLHAAIKNARSF